MRYRRMLLGYLVLVLVANACGGSTEGGIGGGEPEAVVGGDLDVPDYWPSDFYLPDGLEINSVTNLPDADMMSLSGSFGSGDAAAIQQDVVAGLQAAGYELLTNDDIAVFIKNGVGRVRVRTSELLDQLTLSVDIDTWTDAQLDELRALFAEDVVTSGRATARFGGQQLEAVGECRLNGPDRWFTADDVSIALQIDQNLPDGLYADVTTPDGVVYTIDRETTPSFDTTADGFSASGAMVELYNEDAGTIDFTIEAICDL